MPHQADAAEGGPTNELIEGKDYYYEGAFIVFTRRYHLKRGSCCGSGCRHCPYQLRHTRGATARDETARDEKEGETHRAR